MQNQTRAQIINIVAKSGVLEVVILSYQYVALLYSSSLQLGPRKLQALPLG